MKQQKLLVKRGNRVIIDVVEFSENYADTVQFFYRCMERHPFKNIVPVSIFNNIEVFELC